LEIALKNESDPHVYAYENVSHIPTSKLIEIFNINQKKDPYLVQPYMLTKNMYKKHRKYIEDNFVPMNMKMRLVLQLSLENMIMQ
jgi:hypothetical protein